MLVIKNLKAKINNKQILNGVDLTIKRKEIHFLMGPNGSGKSTLAKALSGHYDVEIQKKSKVELDGNNIVNEDSSIRAQMGLFTAFQNSVEIPGVSMTEFLHKAYENIQRFRQPDIFKKISPFKFQKLLEEKVKKYKIEGSLMNRNLNEGFSGGEKKKSEILQMAVLEPRYAILDETDSGLDVTALKDVFESIKKIASDFDTGILFITHYKRVLDYINPDQVHVFINGKIVKSGGKELAEFIDKNGYKKYAK